MPGKFEIKRAKNGQFHFNLKAANGEIILSSEMYTTKRSAKKGIASVRKNSPEDVRYDRRESKSKKPYFVLKAANHQASARARCMRRTGRGRTGSGASSGTAPPPRSRI